MRGPNIKRRAHIAAALIVMLMCLFPLTLSADTSNHFAPRRRRIHFGSMDSLYAPMGTSSSVLLASRGGRKRRQREEEEDEQEDTADSRSKLWPPWPFSLFTQQDSSNNKKNSKPYKSSGALFWAYFRQRLRVTKRQMQHVGSQLWFHLPPAGAPLMLLTAFPHRGTLEEVAAGQVRAAAPALVANAFCRNLVLVSLGAAILSWSHSELNRKRRLVPLPLHQQYVDAYRAILPHALPPEVPDIDLQLLQSMDEDEDDMKTKKISAVAPAEEEEQEGLSPRLKRYMQSFYEVAAPARRRTFKTTMREWRRMREVRRLEAEKVRRAGIFHELVALQALKKKAALRQKAATDTEHAALGYALVTGASRGIGRAIAVELARWEIPLILVARDVNKLTTLASEIETCYGVKCFVLPADLSEPGVAERIHATTKKAGLKVDILVNNAGVCSSGLSVDMPVSHVQQMMQVNAISVAMLNHFYGRDMKEQGRGRILVVSSVVGSVEAGPTVACYAATKAFERSLAMSMGKELEQYGVGVTCLLPGAVGDTAFRSSSQADEALCWKIPFYPCSAAKVAHQGVVAMLAGDVQVVPGWQNRAFLKVFKPILPQRLTTIVVQTAWSPFQFSRPHWKFPKLTSVNGNGNGTKAKKPTVKATPDLPSLWPGAAMKPPPQMLQLPDTPKPASKNPDDVKKDDNKSTCDEAKSTLDDDDDKSLKDAPALLPVAEHEAPRIEDKPTPSAADEDAPSAVEEDAPDVEDQETPSVDDKKDPSTAGHLKKQESPNILDKEVRSMMDEERPSILDDIDKDDDGLLPALEY